MQKKFNLWRRKDRSGIYYVRFQHSPGKWYSSGTTEKCEAEEWAYLNQEPGLKPAPEKVTFRLFAEGFFTSDSQGWVLRQEHRGRSFKAKTLQDYQRYLRLHLLPPFGPRILSSLTGREIDDHLLSLSCSPATKNKAIHTLRIVLQEAVDQKLLTHNVGYDLKLFRETPRHPETFSNEELSKLFPCSEIELMHIWKSFSWAVYFRIMAVGGLRRRSKSYKSLAFLRLRKRSSDCSIIARPKPDILIWI